MTASKGQSCKIPMHSCLCYRHGWMLSERNFEIEASQLFTYEVSLLLQMQSIVYMLNLRMNYHIYYSRKIAISILSLK